MATSKMRVEGESGTGISGIRLTLYQSAIIYKVRLLDLFKSDFLKNFNWVHFFFDKNQVYKNVRLQIVRNLRTLLRT